ncbi:MAG TPA: FAD-binding oxidoreductase [Thermomicrobiales bacterium]|nr:FAD-binding oxidoreductase [Thermomicrobiales bacterium]
MSVIDTTRTQDQLATALDGREIDAFAASLRGTLIRPGDDQYERARRVWNGMIDKRPGLIARCAGTADVVTAVRFAREAGLQVAVRGGGHNVAGNAVNDGGIVIDLSPMKGISVDSQRRLARAQGGVTWGDLDRETQVHGLATPGGEVSMTGIAGYTLSGGLGLLHRKWGLACDNLLSVEVVTADGDVVHASATKNPDLFWAVRGGGGNFGVVTWFEFQLHPLGPEVFSATTIYALDDALSIMRAWRDFTLHAPNEVTSQAVFWSLPAIPDFPEEMHGMPILITAGLYAGSVNDGERALAPLREFSEPVADLSGPTNYVDMQMSFDDFFPDGVQYYWKSLSLNALEDAMIDEIIDLARHRPSPDTLFALRHLGGAISEVAEDATAYGNRQAQYNLSLDATWRDPADNERNIAWVHGAWSDLRERLNAGVYLNFAGLGEENDLLARAGYGRNIERLRAVKRRYDPTNLFQGNINVAP